MVKKISQKTKLPNRLFINKIFIENYKAFSKPTEVTLGP
jgi:hypothetical protein